MIILLTQPASVTLLKISTMFLLAQLLSGALALSLVQSPVLGSSVIESFHVHSSVRYRSANTRFTSVVRNLANHPQGISFSVAMPKESYVTDFSMTTGGVIYQGEIREKTSATQGGASRFTVQKVKSTADSNTFGASMEVNAGDTITFSLSYTELLKRKLAIYEHQIFLNPGQAVKDVYLELFILENTRLTTLKVPALRDFSTARNEHEANNSLVRIDRPSPESAHLVFVPDIGQQGPGGLAHTFVVQYDVEHNPAGDIIVVDGFFIHFFSVDSAPLPKDIVFVLDVSGSMRGNKMTQMKDSIREILGDLRAEDKFNIVIFNHWASAWTYSLVDANTNNINNAMNYVSNLQAFGGTSIYLGITEGRHLYRSSTDSSRVKMIFFLTDGQDGTSISADPAIPIYGLAFGDDADLEYIKSLSANNGGFAKKIYTDINAATQVEDFYDQISQVSYKDVKIIYPPGTVDESTVTKTFFSTVFKGSEVRVMGRLKENVTEFSVDIQLGGSQGVTTQKSEVKNVKELTPNVSSTISESAAAVFSQTEPISMEKTLAVVTIEQKLQEDDKKGSSAGDTKNLEEIQALAVKHQLGTPLTSVVVEDPISGGQLMESTVQNKEEEKDTRTNKFIQSKPAATTRAPTVATTKAWCPPRGSVQEAVKSNILAQQKMNQVLAKCLGSTEISLSKLKKGIAEVKNKSKKDVQRYCNVNNKERRTTIISKSTNSSGNQKHNETGNFPRMFLVSLTVSDAENSACFDPSTLRNTLKRDTTYKLLETDNGTSLFYLTSWSRDLSQVVPHKFLIQSFKGDTATVFLGSRTSWRITGDADFTFQINSSSQMSFRVDAISVSIQRVVSPLAISYFITVELEDYIQANYTGMLGDLLRKVPPSTRKISGPTRIQKCQYLGQAKSYKQEPKALTSIHLSFLVDLMKNVPLRLYS